MGQVEFLNDEQENALSLYVEEWIAIGLSTAPIDRNEYEPAIAQMYELAGLKRPSKIIETRSPFEMYQRYAKMACPTASQDEFYKSNPLPSTVYGQHEAAWLSYYSFFKNECGVEGLEKLEGLISVAKTLGWVIPLMDVAFVSARPVNIERNDRCELHCETRKALEYPDGTGVYLLDGVRVREQVVLAPETMTVAEIKAEANAEIRRVMVTRYGAEKYLLESGANVIDVDQRDSEGGGTRALIQDADSKWLLGTDGSTERPFFMPVDGEATTCKEAHEGIGCITDESHIVIEG